MFYVHATMVRGGPQFSAFLQAYKEYSFCLPPLPYHKAYYKNADLCMLAYTISLDWTGLDWTSVAFESDVDFP